MRKPLLTLAFASQIALGHAAAETRTLHKFNNPKTTSGWQAVNDGVMGGQSSGGPQFCEDGLRFTGNLSLENNGGFSSIRKQERLDLSQFAGIRLKVRGDGREYQLRLNTNARFRGWPVSYSGSFQTSPGKWVVVDVPFADLSPTFRGMKLRNKPFQPDKIEMIGLMLADKRPGKFTLDIELIQAYPSDPKLTARH